jgi:UDP-glucose 4-epimerase
MGQTHGNKSHILVTGGCGYIGSHTIVVLLERGFNIVVVDNLVNSSKVALDRVCQIVGLTSEQRKERLKFFKVDICNEKELRKVFEESPKFQACIHFAGLKAVGESTRIPLKYYENNLGGTFVLLRLMDEFDCHSIVFSSSATVYGAAEKMPITEDTPCGAGITNAYGRTKYMIEEILKDFYNSKTLDSQKTDWSIVVLRYFNPVGAHPTGLVGEDPLGIPNNLMPYVAQVAVGRREYLTVFGDDYDTHDGTGVRDYLHVVDLAEGHLSAIDYMTTKKNGCFTFNLGTGNGYSVLDMVKAMGKACGHDIPYKVGPRRPGDIAVCYADAKLAKEEMGWEAKKDLDEMCKDLWSWQSKNPNGFAGSE